MNAVHRMHSGQWGDRPEVDPRVSKAEQEDRMPDHDSGRIPVWAAIASLSTAPLLLIGAGALVALITR